MRCWHSANSGDIHAGMAMPSDAACTRYTVQMLMLQQARTVHHALQPAATASGLTVPVA